MQGPQTHSAQPIFGLGNQARSPWLSSVDRLNCIVEPIDNGRQAAAILGLPGLVRHARTGDLPARAFFVKKGTLTFYLAVGSAVMTVAPNGTVTTMATLTTDNGPVWMADNGTQLFINDGVTPLIYTYATGLAALVTHADFPAGARGGEFLQARFWVYTVSGTNAGRCYASNQYDGFTWDALNFITPSARPTGITGIDRYADDLVIRGQSSIEWWSGTPTPIAGALGFQPSAGANTEIGSISERGSAKVGQRYYFIGEVDGSSGVYEMAGYKISDPISTPEVAEDLSRRQVANAICTGYTVNNHPILQITIPADTKAGAVTWIYDALTHQWSKRSSHGKPYYRGLFAIGTISAVYITDAFSGNIYRMDEATYTEDGEILEYGVTSAHLLKEGDGFSVEKMQLDIETGLGNPIPPGDNPHAIVQVSKDGGRTWCMERYVTLGKQGQYVMRAQEYQFGWARDWAFRLLITDPVPRRLAGAYLTLGPGYA